jgi:hypothetical protein
MMKKNFFVEYSDLLSQRELSKARIKICRDRADKAKALYQELESEYCNAVDVFETFDEELMRMKDYTDEE